MAKKYNCTKNGVQYFRKTLVIGHKANGKPIVKEFYGDGEKDAENQRQKYIEKRKSGLNINAEKLTIQEGMHEWLFDVLLHSKNKKSASFEKHECNYRNYIKDRPIGCLPIQNAVSLPFQKYYNDLYINGISYISTNGEVKQKAISENKIEDLNKTLRAFFSFCITQKYTFDNPCSLTNIELPGNADGEEDDSDAEGDNIQVFTDAEMEIIKSNLTYKKGKDNTFNVMVQLDFITGLRRGELLGLKKKFLIKYMIKVRNTLKYMKVFDSSDRWHMEMKLIRPKSKSSIRNINYASSFWNTLDLYLQEQEEKWRRNGLEFNDDSLLFTTDTCKPIEGSNFRRAWKRFLKRIHVEYKKPHSIRDTYATTLIRRGAKIHDVKNLLGHSSIKITEKYYIFVFPEDKADTAELLSDFVQSETHLGKIREA